MDDGLALMPAAHSLIFIPPLERHRVALSLCPTITFIGYEIDERASACSKRGMTWSGTLCSVRFGAFLIG